MLTWILFTLQAVVCMAAVIVLARQWLIYKAANPIEVKLPRSTQGFFRFHNGEKVISVDPIAVLNSLDAHKTFRSDLHPGQALLGNREALNIVASAVREAFGVPEFNEAKQPGLSVLECLELLSAFWSWCDVQKKSTEPTPILPPSMESTSTPSTEATSQPSLVSG
jgi:hypothetical protein